MKRGETPRNIVKRDETHIEKEKEREKENEKETLREDPPPPSEALTFWIWFQEQREQIAGLVRERPPHPSRLGAFYAEAMLELGGDLERLKAAVIAFGEDPFWEEKRYPWAAFASQWRKYVPRAA